MLLSVPDLKKAIRRSLSRMRPNVHKGNFGRIFIVAGSRGLTGASRLASMAALRAGAGLVTVGAPKSLAPFLTRTCLEVMWLGLPESRRGVLSPAAFSPALRFLKDRDVLAIGPGLSRDRGTLAFVHKLVRASPKPVVIDADGLAAFWGKADTLRRLRVPVVLTPHPGEFRKLYGRAPKTSLERRRMTEDAVRRFRTVMVLKGHRTVVASPDKKLYINRTGNAGMATAGTGDVLTGVIAAFLGQGMDAFTAAAAGVYVHGLAGDLAARRLGCVLSLVAGDLLSELPSVLRRLVDK